MRDEELELVKKVVIIPSPEWLERRAEQMKNVKIVVGDAKQEMRSRTAAVSVDREFAESERLPDAKGEIASGWEFGGW